jgi:hypothetical protein
MKCKSTTKNGFSCRAQAIKGSRFCFVHDPGSGLARAKARKLGGERRRVGHAGDVTKIPSQVRSIDNVLAILDYTLAETLPLENSVQRGRLLVTICTAFVEVIRTGELESRLTAIENALKEQEIT